MTAEKPAPPLSETLLNSAKYYAQKAGNPEIIDPNRLKNDTQAIFTMLSQADKQTHIKEYFRLLATASILGQNLHSKQGDLAAAKFLFSQAAAAKALEAISILYSVEPTKEEMELLLEKSGFWQYFEPPFTQTDPSANQFTEPTIT